MKKLFRLSSALSVALFGIYFLISSASALVVTPPGPTIGSSTYLPTAEVNQPYSQTILVSGGLSPYTWSVIGGSLPDGLSLETSTGAISGVPTSIGIFSFDVQVMDTNSDIATKNLSVIIGNESDTGFVYTRTPTGDNIVSPLTIRVQGVFGVDFCTDPRATNYRIQYGGRYVDGQGGGQQGSTDTFSHAQGDIVDDTSRVGVSSPSTFYGAVLLCNNASFGYVDGLEGILHVLPSVPTIANPTSSLLTTGMINRAYSYQLEVGGGISPYNWNINSGNLPDGLSLNFSTGLISGTPSAVGIFNFTVQVTDSNSLDGNQGFTVVISPESNTGFIYTRSPAGNMVVSPLTLQVQGVLGVDFCTDPRTTSYKIQYGGRSVNGNTGGIQASTGYVTHAQGDIINDTFTLFMAPGIYYGAALLCDLNGMYGVIDGLDDLSQVVPLTISTSVLPSADVGTNYSQFVQVINGNLPFSWSIISGSLPTGLGLNGLTGEISGTPTTVQDTNFTVQVTDANNQTASKDLSITVHGNTPAGSSVQVISSNTTLTFSNITQEGQTTITASSGGQPPPTGFKLGNPATYYSISTTATFTGNVEICINWTQGQFNNENNLKLFHNDGTNWVNITESGYPDTVNNTICGLTTSFSDFGIFEKKQVEATIDVKPGAIPNTINLGSNGTVPVAIFSNSSFDATTVDPLSVSLASAPVKLKGNGTSMSSFQDVNSDGLLDLIVHVSTEALQLSETDTLANLIGYTLDDTEVIGSDTVRVIQ